MVMRLLGSSSGKRGTFGPAFLLVTTIVLSSVECTQPSLEEQEWRERDRERGVRSLV